MKYYAGLDVSLIGAAADERPWRWSDRGAQLHRHHRRRRAVCQSERCRRLSRCHTTTIPVRRGRLFGSHIQTRRRHHARLAVRGRYRADRRVANLFNTLSQELTLRYMQMQPPQQFIND